MLLCGCGREPEPPAPDGARTGPLRPGEMALVRYESVPDCGYALLFDGPDRQTQDVDELPVGSRVLVIAKEDDYVGVGGEWLTVLAGPGVARDVDENPISTHVRGVVEARCLVRLHPEGPPRTSPTP